MHGVPEERRARTTSPGYAPANDVGLHDFRHADRGSMLRVKGQDGFCPIGPAVVPAVRVRPDRLHACARYLNGEVVQEGSRRRPDLADLLSAGRPVPADHARAGRHCALGHARQLAADGAGRRGRGRGVGARPADEHGGGVGRRPVGPRRPARGLGQHPARGSGHARGRSRAQWRARDRAPPHRPRVPARRRRGRGGRPLERAVRTDRGRAPPRPCAVALRL